MKKLCLILCLLLALVCAAAAEEITCGDYTYTLLNDGTAKITGYTGSNAHLILPAELDGKPVTAIREWAFSYNESLTKVTIPDAIVDVSLTPFLQCSNLSVIEVSSKHPTLAVIDGILYNMPQKALICYPLGLAHTEYVIPHGVESIDDNAFSSAVKLTSVTIPSSVTRIGYDAFSECTALANVTIAEGVTTIHGYAFSGCDALTSITLPDSLTSIDRNIFARSASLKDIIVSPEHPVLAAADGVLFNKADNSIVFYSPVLEAESYEIPQGITRIEAHAFSGSKLQTIVIPDGMVEIGTGAFESCTALTSLVIPATVTTFGDYPFHACPNLTLTVARGSAAEAVAIEEGKPYVCTEPAEDGSWTCACGSVSTGKFCGECGSPKPEADTAAQPELQCAACGCKPADNTAKFCPECGSRF